MLARTVIGGFEISLSNQQMYISLFTIACRYCPARNDDDDDHFKNNRRLVELLVAELEQPLSVRLSDLATVIFSEDEESCLFDKTITVDVYFQDEFAPGCN